MDLSSDEFIRKEPVPVKELVTLNSSKNIVNPSITIKEEDPADFLSVTSRLTLPTPLIKPKSEEIFKDFRCDKCPREFKTKKSLDNHECSICKVCNKKFYSKQVLMRHVKSFHVDSAKIELFECDFCGRRMKNKQGFQVYVIENHSKIPSKFDCDICGFKCKIKKCLINHMTSHSFFKCKICDKIYLKIFKKYHIEQVHGTSSNYKCSKCEKAFKTKIAVKKHERTHIMKFSCKFCNKKFNRMSYYLFHVALHENPAAFMCKICHKKLSTPACLNYHMKSFHYFNN